jgi:hypothetical protein
MAIGAVQELMICQTRGRQSRGGVVDRVEIVELEFPDGQVVYTEIEVPAGGDVSVTEQTFDELIDRCLVQVRPQGMSGGVVLAANTQGVCGFLKASVDHGGETSAGGWIVSVAALARHVPEAVNANKRACAAWRDAADPEYPF